MNLFNEIYTDLIDDLILSEKITKKNVWRKGSKVLKFKTDRPGFKVRSGKEVRMSPHERSARHRAAAKSAKSSKIKKSRTKSFKKTIAKKRS